MKTTTLTSAEFRDELKRLKTNQSAFAAMAEIPLRTVQSWALGERAIPKSAKLLIEKIEYMSTKEKLIAVVGRAPVKGVKALIDIVQIVQNQEKVNSQLEANIEQLGVQIKLMQDQIDRQIRTNSWQADKIAALDKELSGRRSTVQPFNV